MKKIICCFLLSLFISSTVFASPLNGTYENKPIVLVNVDGRVIQPEVPAYIDGGSTMLPLRAVSEAFGAEVTWNQDTYVASIKTRTQVTAGLSLAQLNEIGNSVGLVYALDASGQSYMHGTGFLLQSGIFVTNFHVAGKAASVKIELNGQTYTANTPIFKDEAEDLYAVKINAAGGVKYSTELPAAGSHVYTIGYPHKQFKLNEGNVLNMGKDNGIDVIYHSAKTESGHSGGILVDAKGNVVGVTTGSTEDFTINEAVQMKYVQQELDKLK